MVAVFGWLFRRMAARKGCSICGLPGLAVVMHDTTSPWGLCARCLLHRTVKSLELLDDALNCAVSYGPAAAVLRRNLELPDSLKEDKNELWPTLMLIEALRRWEAASRRTAA